MSALYIKIKNEINQFYLNNWMINLTNRAKALDLSFVEAFAKWVFRGKHKTGENAKFLRDFIHSYLLFNITIPDFYEQALILIIKREEADETYLRY